MSTLVYWHGILGIPGKGPNWMEPYNPDRTIGEIIQSMKNAGLGERKNIEILKFKTGDVSKYDKNNPWWPHDTKLSEVVAHHGGLSGNNIQLVYYMVG